MSKGLNRHGMKISREEHKEKMRRKKAERKKPFLGMTNLESDIRHEDWKKEERRRERFAK